MVRVIAVAKAYRGVAGERGTGSFQPLAEEGGFEKRGASVEVKPLRMRGIGLELMAGAAVEWQGVEQNERPARMKLKAGSPIPETFPRPTPRGRLVSIDPMLRPRKWSR